MRPQRNAAENVLGRVPYDAALSASMRPQRNAAENEPSLQNSTAPVGASMRPQRNAAENERDAVITDGRCARFNEAAA